MSFGDLPRMLKACWRRKRVIFFSFNWSRMDIICLFEHITEIYQIEWRNGSSFQNTAFHNLFGIDHVLIVLNLNSSKALKMLPIGTTDLLYVIESAFQTRKTIGHVQVLYLLSMLHKDGISIHQTVQSLAMVSFSALDGSKELVIFRASSNDPKSQSCSV